VYEDRTERLLDQGKFLEAAMDVEGISPISKLQVRVEQDVTREVTQIQLVLFDRNHSWGIAAAGSPRHFPNGDVFAAHLFEKLLLNLQQDFHIIPKEKHPHAK
jgi:hypothetical protein